MWIVFSFLLLLWVLSIHLYFPVLAILGLFAGMLLTAGLALLPARE
ncbi:MAG: hypothetical protein ACXVZQ_13090 [Terriglobales bacterium]